MAAKTLSPAPALTSAQKLADQQSALLSALFLSLVDAEAISKNIATYADTTGTSGLFVYQNNAQALCVRVLQAAYPVVAQLLGDDNFEPLAHALWCGHPPQRGDLAHWGGDLPGFVARHPQLTEEPFLADVAALEWALHSLAACADRQPEPASFALLMAHDPTEIYLHLAPGAAVVQSGWPIVSLWQAHQNPQAAGQADNTGHTTGHTMGHTMGHTYAIQNEATYAGMTATTAPNHAQSVNLTGLESVVALLQQQVGQTAIVWRNGHLPLVREALAGEALFVQALLAGQSLGAALDATLDRTLGQSDQNEQLNPVDPVTQLNQPNQPNQKEVPASSTFDFNVWLPLAVQTGLLLAASARVAAEPVA